MRGVDHDDVDFGVDQRLGALETLVTDCGRSSHAQAAVFVLGGFGIGDRLLDVLDGDEADAAPVIVDDEQLLDAALVQQAARLVLAGAQRHGGEVFRGHEFLDRLARVFGKAHVAVGQDADQLARKIGHGNAADAVGGHDFLRLAKRGVGADRDGVHHHAAFITLHGANGSGLFLDLEVAV